MKKCNIMMIGDSWGVPNYARLNEVMAPVEGHTENRLRSLGHNVFNYSLNGGSNLDTIEYARAAIKNYFSNLPPESLGEIENKRKTYAANDIEPKYIPRPDYKGERIDYIIWFHTESVRIDLLPILYPYITFSDIHDISTKICYRAFAKLVEFCRNPKTIVIGGQAPVDPRLYEYHKPTHVIEDWRSEIVGRKLPFCHTLSRLNILEKMNHDKDTMLEFMETHKIIYDSMLDEKLFFDRCHPGSYAHEQLTNKIDDWIQQQKSTL